MQRGAYKTVLYIDGENFLFKAAEILKASGKIRHKSDITQFHFSLIEQSALSEFTIDEKRFYAAKVHLHKDSKQLETKSMTIIESQRRLKRSLMNDGVEFIISGNVRLQDIIPGKKGGSARYILRRKDSCDQTILLRKQEIIDAWLGKQGKLV